MKLTCYKILSGVTDDYLEVSWITYIYFLCNIYVNVFEIYQYAPQWFYKWMGPDFSWLSYCFLNSLDFCLPLR